MNDSGNKFYSPRFRHSWGKATTRLCGYSAHFFAELQVDPLRSPKPISTLTPACKSLDVASPFMVLWGFSIFPFVNLYFCNDVHRLYRVHVMRALIAQLAQLIIRQRLVLLRHVARRRATTLVGAAVPRPQQRVNGGADGDHGEGDGVSAYIPRCVWRGTFILSLAISTKTCERKKPY